MIPKASREAVSARCGGQCERCRAHPTVDLHHRRPRGMGETKNPDIHIPANLTALCRDCHGWVESNRKVALEQGWLISQHDTREPYEIPIYTHGSWYLINPEWHPYDFTIPF